MGEHVHYRMFSQPIADEELARHECHVDPGQRKWNDECRVEQHDRGELEESGGNCKRAQFFECYETSWNGSVRVMKRIVVEVFVLIGNS